MGHRTGLYREVEDKLGSSLDEFIAARRVEPTKKSWRLIARDIEDATGMALTPETLRVWFTYHRHAPEPAHAQPA